MENIPRDQATAQRFFARMNDQQVDYAVLRNYEQFPSFGHDIDLVVRWSHLPQWKAIASACAAEFNWSALTECDHWAKSRSREHTIQILRFYSMEPVEYLQIDAFHATVVNGLPLFNEEMLFGGRVWDDRGFYRIDERAENFFRLFQIARLIGVAGTGERIARYTERAIGFWNAAGDLEDYGARIGFPRILSAVERLKCGELRCYKQEIDRQKRAWWTAQVRAHPLRSAATIFNRIVDYLRLYWLRPCGFAARVCASGEHRVRLDAIMSRLVGANFIPAYTAGAGMKMRHRVLERGGVVVEWVSAERSDLIVDAKVTEDEVTAKLVSLIVGRHSRVLEGPSSANE